MNQTRTTKSLTVLALTAAFALISLAGCDESKDRQVGEKSKTSVNISQRLIRASNENLPLTEQEINQAAKVDSSRQRTSLAKKVVQRWAKATDSAESEKLMTRLNQLSTQLTTDVSTEGLNEYYGSLMATTQSLLAQQQAFGSLAAVQSENKLADAEKILNAAMKSAKANGDRSALIAPGLTLGALHLIRARDGSSRLSQNRLAVQNIKVSINYLAGNIKQQEAIASTAKALSPERTIAELQTELSSLQLQVEQNEQKLSELQTKQRRTKLKFDENSSKAYKIHQEYLKKMQESDQVRGEQQYALRQDAYDLRIGTDDPLLPGSLYYEAKAELTQNDLNIIEEEIGFQQLRHRQLTKNIEGISLTIQQLQSSPATTTDLSDILQSSTEEKASLVASLNSKLEELKTAETTYAQVRVDVVDAYRKALDVFGNASSNAKAADRRSPTVKYADSLKDIAKNELAQLWLSDADFYQAASAVLDLAGDVEETRKVVSTMSQNYKNQAQQAQTSAAELEDKK